MLALCRRIKPFSFAGSVTRDSVNYYQVLELQNGATEDAIRKAYAELTANIKP